MANWLEFWENNEINWHSDVVTQELEEYLGLLKLEPGDKVFFPLCGKSLDMNYILNQGFSVIGVELSEIGIKQFFYENGLDFTVSQVGEFDLYSAKNIEIYCGDFFSLTAKHLRDVKAGVFKVFIPIFFCWINILRLIAIKKRIQRFKIIHLSFCC